MTCQESGAYNCTTQRGHTNTLRVIVTEDTCGHVPVHDGIVTNNAQDEEADTWSVGSRVQYSCPPGYNLQGDQEVFCRDDGERNYQLRLPIIIF